MSGLNKLRVWQLEDESGEILGFSAQRDQSPHSSIILTVDRILPVCPNHPSDDELKKCRCKIPVSVWDEREQIKSRIRAILL